MAMVKIEYNTRNYRSLSEDELRARRKEDPHRWHENGRLIRDMSLKLREKIEYDASQFFASDPIIDTESIKEYCLSLIDRRLSKMMFNLYSDKEIEHFNQILEMNDDQRWEWLKGQTGGIKKPASLIFAFIGSTDLFKWAVAEGFALGKNENGRSILSEATEIGCEGVVLEVIEMKEKNWVPESKKVIQELVTKFFEVERRPSPAMMKACEILMAKQPTELKSEKLQKFITKEKKKSCYVHSFTCSIWLQAAFAYRDFGPESNELKQWRGIIEKWENQTGWTDNDKIMLNQYLAGKDITPKKAIEPTLIKYQKMMLIQKANVVSSAPSVRKAL